MFLFLVLWFSRIVLSNKQKSKAVGWCLEGMLDG